MKKISISKNSWGGVTLNGTPVATYPINSLYISLDNTSPASIYGGTWECIAQNVNLPLGELAPVIPTDAVYWSTWVGDKKQQIVFNNYNTLNPGTTDYAGIYASGNNASSIPQQCAINYDRGLKVNLVTESSISISIWKRIS